MPALVAGIHVFLADLRKQDVDGRTKSGHDARDYSLRSATVHRTAASIFAASGVTNFSSGGL